MSLPEKKLPIQFSCYFSRSSAGEQFIPEHAIGYIVSGSFQLNDGKNKRTFHKGDLYFCRRNNLNKYLKSPSPETEFRSVSIFFDQPTLRQFSREFGYTSEKRLPNQAFDALPTETMLTTYMEQLRSYEPVLTQNGSEELLLLKQKEALLILLKIRPDLKQVLFDFSEPGKIDLEAFMNKNYHFNVELKRFAYLTGRSLSTFKRDFEMIFKMTPSRWLLQKRLKEAYYQIKEKKRAVSDVYLDVGFEDLSHFSYVFKKEFGLPPSFV